MKTVFAASKIWKKVYSIEGHSTIKEPFTGQTEEVMGMNATDSRAYTVNRSELLDREKIKKKNWNYYAWRRIRDVIFALLGLALLSPMLLILMAVIVIDSPGAGPFFKQKRVGKNGREFTFYKFRSMYPNAEARLAELLSKNEMQGPVFKIKEDPRITRVGKFIRKTSIDELPQLWNVLKGDMSIVGPRPGLPREVAQYDNYAYQRLFVKPGITCLWQIQPRRNDLTFDQWVDLDIEYIRNRSLWLDMKIIFKTFGAVLGMNGE